MLLNKSLSVSQKDRGPRAIKVDQLSTTPKAVESNSTVLFDPFAAHLFVEYPCSPT